jgi:hypothetical protein
MPAPWHTALLDEPSEYDRRIAQIKADFRQRELDRRCGQPSKQWGGQKPCLLDKGHKGYHSISVFCCDQCGKYRRNPYIVAGVDADGEVAAVVCFPCVARDRKPGWDY